MPVNYRFDPYNDALEPKTYTDQIYRVPATTPYDIKLSEVPYKTSPSSMSMRVADTLSAAITSTTATTISVNNGSWFAAGKTITIDTEQMYVSAVSSNTLTVTRGYNSTTANTHILGVSVFIEGSMTEVSSTPSSGQFYPDYSCEVTSDTGWNTGTLRFSSSDAGKRIAVSYKGLGTLADDRIIDFVVSPNLRNFGTASDGDYTSTASFTASSAILNYRNFTLLSGHTMTGVGPLQVIFCTDTCTIAGTITTAGLNDGVGGGGGAGGWVSQDYVTISSPVSRLGNIEIQSSAAFTDSQVNQFITFFHFTTMAGSRGAKGSGVTTYGKGGGGLIVIAKSINFTGTINANGGGGSSTYAGGGGGGAVIMAAKTWVASTGAISVAGGSCSFNGCWSGGAGWYRKLTIE